MPTKAEVATRRDKISKLLAKSVTRPSDIASMLKIPERDVKNDLYWMRKETREWLTGYALDGFVMVTRTTISQMEDMEVELQKLRQDLTPAANSPPQSMAEIETRLRVMKELRETINTRWVIQGDGPTLMQVQAAEAMEIASKNPH